MFSLRRTARYLPRTKFVIDRPREESNLYFKLRRPAFYLHPPTFLRAYEDSNLDFRLRRPALYPLSYRRRKVGGQVELRGQILVRDPLSYGDTEKRITKRELRIRIKNTKELETVFGCANHTYFLYAWQLKSGTPSTTLKQYFQTIDITL